MITLRKLHHVTIDTEIVKTKISLPVLDIYRGDGLAKGETLRPKYPTSYAKGLTIGNMILKESTFVREIASATLSPERNNLGSFLTFYYYVEFKAYQYHR